MEEYRLKVFEKRLLIRIFGSNRKKVEGEWRKLVIICILQNILLLG